MSSTPFATAAPSPGDDKDNNQHRHVSRTRLVITTSHASDRALCESEHAAIVKGICVAVKKVGARVSIEGDGTDATQVTNGGVA